MDEHALETLALAPAIVPYVPRILGSVSGIFRYDYLGVNPLLSRRSNTAHTTKC